MGIYLNPGNRMLQRALDAQFYVDKSALVSFMNARLGLDSGFVAVSRPRRFGKSVDANMLCAYYSRGSTRARSSRGWRWPPTRASSATSAPTTSSAWTPSGSSGAAAESKTWLRRSRRRYSRTSRPSGPTIPRRRNLPKALDVISEAKGSGFVFVIDEWDCPMREAADDEDLQRRWLDFLRDLFKGAPYVDAAYMTGILPIKKYGRHSALNLFDEYSLVDPKDLAPLVGFDEGEVRGLCERFGMDFAEMAHWYDGYLIGPGPEPIHVYNPNSVARAIGSGHFSNYWTSTETYEALRVYIDMDFDGVQQDLVAMLDGQRVAADVSTFDNTMTGVGSRDETYALLVHLGYLGYDEDGESVFIPNEEIRRESRTAIRTGARPELARLVRDSRELQRRTLEGDAAYVADAVRRAPLCTEHYPISLGAPPG